MRKILAIILVLALSSFISRAQTVEISGTVTSEDDQSPLPGVFIKLVGGNATAVTSAEGKYSIPVEKGSYLEFSCLGMTSKTIRVSDEKQLNVTLATDVENLDDAMIIAYGTTKKESFTGSAEVVGSDKIKDRAASDVTKLLDGQVAGVMMTSGSGQPGSGSSFLVRGFGSINASQYPLIVVDGIPYDGSLSSISSDDIKQISVLKDASAGALYGARGANGVILITTGSKSGKESTSVEFGAKFGIVGRAIPRYDTMSAKEYMEYMYSVAYNDLVYTEGYLPQVAKANTASKLSKMILGTNDVYNIFNKDVSELFDGKGAIVPDAKAKYDADWLKTAEREIPLRQEYRFAISKRGDNSSCSASLNYVDEQGTLKTTGFKRYGGRIETSFHPKDWVDFDMHINYSNSKTNFLGAGGSTNSNVWYSAMMMAPIYPVYKIDASGNYLLENGQKVFDYGSSRPAGAQNSRNSIATLYDDDYYNISDNVNGRARLGLIWKDFKFDSNFGVDNVSSYQTTKYNIYNGNAAGTGRLSKENSRMISYTWNQLLSCKKAIGAHHVDAMAGHEFYHYNMRYLSGEKTGFAVPDFDELGLGSTIANSYSESDNYSINSWLGRANYDYQNKYYFSGSIRTDASSRFKKENRWGVFWSVGASWRISEENFLKEQKWIDNINLKASYGVQGNDNLGDYYAWQSLYNMYYSNGSHSGAIIYSLENSDVTWEKNGNFNVGAEFRLFGRLNGTIEWYERDTRDLLLAYPIPTSLGIESYNSNVGEITNSGFDIGLGYTAYQNQDWVLKFNLIASTLRNKVRKLTGEGSDDIVNGVYLIREGEEINSFYVAKSAGIDPTTGEQLYYAYKKDANGNKIGGSEYITNDRTAAAGSKYILGSRIPDVYGSFSTEVRYKNVDFSFMMGYSLGGKVFDSVYRSLMEPSYVGQTYHKNAKRSWSYPGQITDVPRGNSDLTTLASDRFLVDASYLSIKNVTLGYRLGPKFLKAAKINSARIYFSAESPWILTHMKGMNPQANFSGSTSYAYVPNKSLTFGVDINF